MENMTKGQMAKAKLDEIKVLLKVGDVSYDEAEKMAAPHLKIMNEEMARISKENGFKPRGKVTFIGYMR